MINFFLKLQIVFFIKIPTSNHQIFKSDFWESVHYSNHIALLFFLYGTVTYHPMPSRYSEFPFYPKDAQQNYWSIPLSSYIPDNSLPSVE